MYSKGLIPDVEESFVDNFEYWEDEHFKSLPSLVNISIRNSLLKGGLPIEKQLD